MCSFSVCPGWPDNSPALSPGSGYGTPSNKLSLFSTTKNYIKKNTYLTLMKNAFSTFLKVFYTKGAHLLKTSKFSPWIKHFNIKVEKAFHSMFVRKMLIWMKNHIKTSPPQKKYSKHIFLSDLVIQLCESIGFCK